MGLRKLSRSVCDLTYTFNTFPAASTLQEFLLENVPMILDHTFTIRFNLGANPPVESFCVLDVESTGNGLLVFDGINWDTVKINTGVSVAFTHAQVYGRDDAVTVEPLFAAANSLCLYWQNAGIYLMEASTCGFNFAMQSVMLSNYTDTDPSYDYPRTINCYAEASAHFLHIETAARPTGKPLHFLIDTAQMNVYLQAYTIAETPGAQYSVWQHTNNQPSWHSYVGNQPCQTFSNFMDNNNTEHHAFIAISS